MAVLADADAASLPDAAWAAALAAARLARGRGRAGDPACAMALLEQDGHGIWHARAGAGDARRDPLAIYLPLVNAGVARPLVIAHIGQSVDGFIATTAGESHYVTGRENIVHLHRLRALADAVIVGAGTVAADDPRLTTRLVPGPSPLRVVIDPRGRLPADRNVFNDGAAATLVVRDAAFAPGHGSGSAQTLPVPCPEGRADLAALLAALHERGCHAVLVEGGGVTVSAFLAAGLLDRLQIAVAPLVIGAGRPGLRLPPATSLAACLRPQHELYRMGDDVLFDFDLRGAPLDRTGGAPA
jgi:riboflavin-specific deaminase-like protein